MKHMSTVSKSDLVRDYAAVLRGFGLSREGLGAPHDGDGDLSPGAVEQDLEVSRPEGLFDRLRGVLARSDRGIQAPREYWSQAPAFQLSEVLEPFGYDVSFEPVGDDVDEQFRIVLRGGPTTGTREMTFSYPDSEHGTDNYPALVHAVETRLLPEPDLRFVRLSDDGDDPWRFVLVERGRLAKLRKVYGDRVEVFDRPLLAADQPADFAIGDDAPDAPRRDGPAEEVRSLVADGEIDDVFERIERTAATQPVGGTAEADAGDVDHETSQLIRSVDIDREGAAAMGDVSRERIDEFLDAEDEGVATDPSSFEWLSSGASSDPAPDTGDGRLSEQVAQALFPDEDPERRAASAPQSSPDREESAPQLKGADRAFGDLELSSAEDDTEESTETLDTGSDLDDAADDEWQLHDDSSTFPQKSDEETEGNVRRLTDAIRRLL